MEVILLITGLIGLWLGTELTIHGAVSIANRFGISEFIVGIVFLSIGSDLPELTIAIDGAIRNLQTGQVSDVIVGSALGSALGQIGAVLGIAGLFGYLTLPRTVVYRHGSILLGSLVILALVGIDGTVSRTEGISLITIYVIYLVVLFTDRTGTKAIDADGSSRLVYRSWVYLLLGLGIVIGSAEITVGSVTRVAAALNIEQSFIAIIIIGLGTSLPELSISVGAILKRRSQLSVGNLIGSNIFDTLVPIGVAASISGLDFNSKMLRGDLPFLFILSALVMILFIGKRGMQRREGTIVLVLYCAYVLVRIGGAPV